MTVSVASGMAAGSWSAFGRSLQDLARAGRPPVVLLDSLRWLARYALTAPNPFTSVGDKRKLLALKQLYDSGKRPLRNKAGTKDPVLVANLLLLWLGSLPEPLFPAEYVPDLLKTQQTDCYGERVAAVRGFLKKTEPFILEALFPLFEFLHHHLINQADRDGTLQELGRMFAPFVFGTPQEYCLPLEDASLPADTVELMIAEYRPLFTQPYGLNRYEKDAARQQAAADAKAQATGEQSDAAWPLAHGLAQLRTGFAVEEFQGEGQQQEDALSQFWSPFSCFADGSPLPGEEGGSPFWGEEACTPQGEEARMESVLSSLLESAVSAMFEEVVVEKAAFDEVAAAPPAGAASAAMPVPNKASAAHSAFISADSFTSEDWGSFSPTGFLLEDGGYPCGGCNSRSASAVAQHGAGVWGCKPAAFCGELGQLGSGSRVLA